MPSTVVHLAIGALVATALLETEFDARSLGIILLVVFLPDIDTFIGIYLHGWHRAALHTLFVPALATAVIILDLERDESWLRARGPRALQLAWVSVIAYVIAGIGPDLFYNGVNLFWPLHDQFYVLNGKLELSTEHGLVQTLWEAEQSRQGTTADRHFRTGIDVTRGPDPAGVERTFPIANTGLQVLLLLTAIIVTGIRLRSST